VKIVRLPGLPDGGDIYDWFEEHDAQEPEALRAQILKMAEQAKPKTKSAAETESDSVRPVYVWMKDVEAKPVSWLWQDRVPSAMLSLFIGLEGSGKTFCALDLAARISTGRPLPGGIAPYDIPPVGNVVFLTSEDHLNFTIRPRLDAMKADPARIVALKGVIYPEGDSDFFDVMRHLPALEALLQEAAPVRLLLVDPLTAFLGATDQHKNGEVRIALARFNALAERYNCAVIGISHLSKDISRAAIHRTIGSVAFSAAARAVWLISADRDEPERVLFVPVKMNLAPLAKSLAFRIQDMAVVWEDGQFDYEADEVLAAGKDEQGALADACQWLSDLLADGRVRSSEVWKLAAKEKIAEKTLRRAQKKVGVVARKDGIGMESFWYWELAKGVK
jgi:RecA-family ATPase